MKHQFKVSPSQNVVYSFFNFLKNILHIKVFYCTQGHLGTVKLYEVSIQDQQDQAQEETNPIGVVQSS